MDLSIIAIVLAGGRSSRMGTDKALLEIDGIPLLTRTCRVAGIIATKTYVITPRTEKYRSLLPQDCILIKETIIEGENRSNSPLIGFAQALNYLEEKNITADWILLLACDLPCLDDRELLRWRQLLMTIDSATMTFLPKNSKGWGALCGFYRPSCKSSLEAYIDGNRRSFQGWLKDLAVEELVASDDRIFFNCNTPEDFIKIATEFNGDRE
jgi:molybdopterin-guanine dinucleotide biosynthesis protein A